MSGCTWRGRARRCCRSASAAGGLHIAYATAEITGIADGRVTFRSLGDEAVVAVDGRARCEGAKSSYEGGRTILRVRRREFTVREG